MAISVIIACIAGIIVHHQYVDPARYFSAFTGKKINSQLTIVYPFDGTLFPPEICAPAIRWKDPNHIVRKWLISISFRDGGARIDRFSDSTQWTPSDRQWQFIKQHSTAHQATIVVIGIRGWRAVSYSRVDLRTSTDPVGAPLFYREVILPFKEAVKDPTKIRWHFGSITHRQSPPVVLEKLPVCGNCHSFSADGTTMGMDVDYANDKGSYAIVPVGNFMTLDSSDIITWNDFRKKDNDPTYGLLSQISPDGRWAASTVKDLSVFVPKPELDFSQLFFPVRGIVAVYNRATRAFSAIPGADDPAYVQSNPVWSPDGKRLLFIRSKVYDLNLKSRQVLLSPEQCADFLEKGKLFLYDICQIPFNDGRGGAASPLIGASKNGMSNYFPRFSPDGKWIVFCKAKSFSLLQPDSRLYIMPAGGGEPRSMTCNRDCMNSWHSWSPNGKWLVFSSKTFSPYTELFLTHIDEKGMDTPPVALEWLTAPDRAANIPEFVNAPETAIARIQERFVNDVSYLRAAREYVNAYDLSSTVLNLFRKAIEINPRNAQAQYGLGTILATIERPDEATVHFHEAIRLDSNFLMAYCNLATAYAFQGRLDDASSYYRGAIERKNSAPATDENTRAIIYAHSNLALIYVKQGSFDKGVGEYAAAIRMDPASPDLHCGLGDIFINNNDLQKAKIEYDRAIGLNPNFERALYNRGIVYQKMNMPEKALEAWEKVLNLNPENADALRSIESVKERRL